MRLHKYMAMCGVASRRKSEAIILEGRVTLNGEVVTTLGSAFIEGDLVKVDGNIISLEEKKVYIMLNKPLNCVTTSSDQFARKTVLDFIDDIDERIYPVGRLDYNTTGLLLLTNDGDLSYKITHPSTHLNKTYLAKVQGCPDEKDIKAFESGMVIDDYKTSPAELTVKKKSSESTVEVTIHEGRNRQVRKMLDAIDHPVITLKRISIGLLELKDLKIGQYRHLSNDEINYLKNYKR